MESGNALVQSISFQVDPKLNFNQPLNITCCGAFYVSEKYPVYKSI